MKKFGYTSLLYQLQCKDTIAVILRYIAITQ